MDFPDLVIGELVILEQFLPSVGMAEGGTRGKASGSGTSQFVYGRCCFRPSLSFPSPILPGWSRPVGLLQKMGL